MFLDGGLDQIYIPGVYFHQDRLQSRFDWFGPTPDWF